MALLITTHGGQAISHDPSAPSKGYVYNPPANLPGLAALSSLPAFLPADLPADLPALPTAARLVAAHPDGWSFVYAVRHSDAPFSVSSVQLSRGSSGRALQALPVPALPTLPVPGAGAQFSPPAYGFDLRPGPVVLGSYGGRLHYPYGAF